MAITVITVVSGGLPVVDVSATTPLLGAPVTEAANGRGMAVTKVTLPKGGLPVTYMTETAAFQTIDDGATYPNDRYASGSYLAFQAINDTVSASTQTMVINQLGFPSGVRFNWIWPDAADTTVKSWNAVDFGNYLNTDVPIPITPSKINALDALKVRSVWTYTMAADSANLTMDFFLFSTSSSTVPNMLCEFQIFYHTPDSTKTFVDSVTNLGTYTSAAIDGTPSIAWKVGRQTANFFGTPYYLFYPSDQSDKLDMTFDIKAALAWLMAPNPTTSITYLTGNEYFNGLGTGVEPLRKTGTATLVNYLVTYTPTAIPAIPPTLPPNTNLVPLAARTDFTNAFWSGSGVTRTTGGFTEDISTGAHGIHPASPVTVSASTVYTYFVDVDVTAGQPWLFLQIQSSSFTSDVQAYFNPATLAVSGLATSGVFTAPVASVALLTTGKYRVTLSANTGAGTTAVYFSTRSATAAGTQSYAGSVLKSVALANPFFYT